MSDEIDNFKLYKKNEPKKYKYEFIPYKKIGNILLDKTDGIEMHEPHLRESGLNYVVCQTSLISPIPFRSIKSDDVSIIYNGIEIELTRYFDKFLEKIKQITDDIVIEKSKDSDGKEYIDAYSEKLGIWAYVTSDEESKPNLLFYVIFMGNEQFKNRLAELEYKKTHITSTDNMVEKISTEPTNFDNDKFTYKYACIIKYNVDYIGINATGTISGLQKGKCFNLGILNYDINIKEILKDKVIFEIDNETVELINGETMDSLPINLPKPSPKIKITVFDIYETKNLEYI